MLHRDQAVVQQSAHLFFESRDYRYVRRRPHAAAERLASLGYDVDVRVGDGYHGLPEAAPFDAVIITAAAPSIPPALIEQLRDGGKLLLPLGPHDGQTLLLCTKRGSTLEREDLGGVAFVPMTGKVRKTH